MRRSEHAELVDAVETCPVLSLVVPAYGDESMPLACLEQVARALDGLPYELLMVGGSESESYAHDGDDPSARLVRVLPADSRWHRARQHAGAHALESRSSALAHGIQLARGRMICVLDGRMPGAPELLPALVRAAEDADLVVASRNLPGADQTASASLTRRLRAAGYTALASALFARVRRCSDPLSGLYLFRREVVDGLQPRPVASGSLLDILVRGRWSRLTEVPYVSNTCTGTADGAAQEVRMAASVAEDDALSLWHLRDLRLSQRPERRPICYRTLRLPAGADDPQPLDDDLPEDPEIAGTQRRRLLWTVGLLALALRLVLLPIGHYWDLTIDYNTFIDLAHNHSPYDTMAYLSQIARSAHWDTAYEYYAYPPLPLYLYYPLAHLYAWLHPTATYFIPVSGTHALPNLTLDFFFLLKLPIWMADFAIAALLARMSGTVRGWRDYLLNPYVLLVSGAWTFDALMVLGLLAGAYWLQQGKFAKAGLALAFGTMIKFVPVLMVPTFVLYLIKKQRTPREIALFAGSYLAGCVVLLGPFLSGLLYVLGFHSTRVGGGMNWENYWRLWRLFPPGTNLNPISLAIGAFGTPTLAILLLLAYWYAFTSPMRFNRMIIVTLLVFFVGSKLINEQYALILFPFAYIEARQVGGAWRWFFRLFWIVPLAFAIMHVPIDRFLWLLYHMIFRARADVITTTGLTGFESPFVPWQNGTLDQVLVALLGLAFTLLSAVALLWPVRPVRRPIRHEMLPASQGLVHAAPTATTTAHASVHGARDPSGSGGSGDTAPQPPIAVPR